MLFIKQRFNQKSIKNNQRSTFNQIMYVNFNEIEETWDSFKQDGKPSSGAPFTC